jgi:hypothetical protein
MNLVIFCFTVWKYLKPKFQVASISGLSCHGKTKQIRQFVFWENLWSVNLLSILSDLYWEYQSMFYVIYQHNFFRRKFHFKNINVGDHFLEKTFFSRFNFRTTLLSKIMPNFWWTDIPRRNLLKNFLMSMLIPGQKSYFLGLTIFKIPRPNWYYYVAVPSLLSWMVWGRNQVSYFGCCSAHMANKSVLTVLAK